MTLCIIFNVLAVLLGAVAMGAFVIAIFDGFDGGTLIVSLVATALAVVLGLTAFSIEKANTTTDVDVVQMEVTKCDMTSVRSNGVTQIDCYVTVGNKYMVEVSTEKYAELNVGDVVLVEIETKTVFGEVAKPTVRLKG